MDIFIRPLTTFALLQCVAIVVFRVTKQMKGQKMCKSCTSYMRVCLLNPVASKADIAIVMNIYEDVGLQISHRQSIY